MSKESEGIFDDSVVYVTKQGSQVGVDGGRITIYMKGEGELASFPMGQVDTINIFGNINFTTPFVARANEHGIVLNYFTQNGRYRGSFVPEKNTIAEVRRCQYALSEKEGLKIAKEIIRGKIRNSRTLLNRKDVPDNGRLAELEEETARARDLDNLRGMEGEAAETYFGLLNGCLADGWTFERRTRRPPEDHMNALLSLTYSMMKNEVLSALRQYNLDPFLGILHADRHGRPALALDLLEDPAIRARVRREHLLEERGIAVGAIDAIDRVSLGLLDRLGHPADVAVAENAETAGEERILHAVVLDILIFKESNECLRHGEALGLGYHICAPFWETRIHPDAHKFSDDPCAFGFIRVRGSRKSARAGRAQPSGCAPGPCSGPAGPHADRSRIRERP